MTQIANLDRSLNRDHPAQRPPEPTTGHSSRLTELESNAQQLKSIFERALDAVAVGEIQVAKELIARAGQQVLGTTPAELLNESSKPVRIFSLGRFDVLIDGENRLAGRKSSARPIELLKCLITFGSRQVSQYRVIECLWPDINGDAAMNVFSSTLCRLRGLLGYKQAIKLKSGQLTLNPDYIWVDVWELERKISRIDAFQQSGKQELATLGTVFDEICRAYKGPFLGEGNEYIWSMGYREKIVSRMLNMYRRLGTLFMSDQDIERAEYCFNKGIDLDPLQESFYRELMRVYVNSGRVADAAAVYQKCRKQLSSVLGVSPSSETIQIYKSLCEAS